MIEYEFSIDIFGNIFVCEMNIKKILHITLKVLMSVTVVEGIIGSGKTTFSKQLASDLEGLWLREPDEKSGNKYLPFFYENPTRWALTMQLHLLNTRYRMHKNAQWTSLQQNTNVVMDRSYFGDTAFAKLQLENKTLTPIEYETYKLSYENMTASVMLPDFCVHLHTNPVIAQNRISKRMKKETGRECETVIDIQYLENLQKHETSVIESLRSLGVKIFDIEYSEDRSDDEINQLSFNIASQILSFQKQSAFL